MKRIGDKVFISVLIFLLLFFWSLYFTRSWWQSAILAVAASVLVILIWLTVSVRVKKSRTPSRIEVFRLLAAMGYEESTALLYDTLPVHIRSDFAPPSFVLNGDTLVYNNLKFTPTIEEDIAKMYRLCKAKGLSKAIFVAARTDRKMMSLAAYLGISAYFPDRFTIKNYLVRHNAVPQPPEPVQFKLPKLKIKELAPIVFDRRKVKYYLFSGIMLLLMSLITPLRLYYLIFSSVPMVLAIISLFIKE
ncbi:MAG: hypothetical protein PHI19_01660 [Clostridia bacterium]|nr:hypothetical protein [Clostridia bacterium]